MQTLVFRTRRGWSQAALSLAIAASLAGSTGFGAGVARPTRPRARIQVEPSSCPR